MKIILAAALFALALPAAADNETASLLKAHRVPHALYIRIAGTGLEYAVDEPRNFLTLGTGETFAGQTQVDLAYPQFNPFKIKIETSEDLRDDPTAAAVAAFLQKVLDTAQTVLPAPGVSASSTGATQTVSAQTAEFRVAQARVSALQASTGCDFYRQFDTALSDLRGKMNAIIVKPSEVSEWVDSSMSASRVASVRQLIATRIGEINDNEAAIVALLKTINDKFAASQSTETCAEIRTSTLASLLDISQLASKARATKLSLATTLTDLNKALKPYADETRWRDEHSYIFLKPQIDPAKVDAITVNVRTRTIDTSALTFTDSEPVKQKFDLRQYQRVIPEVAAAIIYTDLSYPTWGTRVEGTQTVVEPGKPAHFPVQGAMVLNGVFPGNIASIYPALQFGISTAKEFPGFLAGIALRSVGTKQFSLSVGRMLTYYRTLSTLQKGSVVTGTADLEKDMKLKRAPLAWYGGVQYSF